jgi:hypothetical protein
MDVSMKVLGLVVAVCAADKPVTGPCEPPSLFSLPSIEMLAATGKNYDDLGNYPLCMAIPEATYCMVIGE